MKPINAYLGSLWVKPLEIKLDANFRYYPNLLEEDGILKFLINGTVRRSTILIDEHVWLPQTKDEKQGVKDMIEKIGSMDPYKYDFSDISLIKPKMSREAIELYIKNIKSRCIQLLDAFEILQNYEKKAEKNRKDLIKELIFS